MSDPFVGSLTFVRVYSGIVTSGSQVLNSVKSTRERVGRMLQMHANHREDIKEARAGDILAFAGLKNTTTGDTLCDPGDPVVLYDKVANRWLISQFTSSVSAGFYYQCVAVSTTATDAPPVPRRSTSGRPRCVQYHPDGLRRRTPAVSW